MTAAFDVLPVTIVTGFLGSGKSTLLADVLHGEYGTDTAVLVNEFGDVGLDHLLIGEVSTRIVLLDNGCVCCSIRGELKEALATLFSQRARGELPPFSRVVLETTGLATPAPIIATLIGDPVVRSHFRLNAVLTVVDGANWEEQRARHPEWLAQVTAADRLLISKADLADAAQCEALQQALAELNPAAAVSVRAPGDADRVRHTLFEPGCSADMLQRLGSGARIFNGDGRYRLSHRADASGADASPVAADDVHAFCIVIDTPIDWQVFTIWFTMLLNRHGDKILRVKGLLAIAGSDTPAVLHGVQHLVHPVLHLDVWPDERRVTRLIFITQGIAQSEIEASYGRFCRHFEESPD
jgi:G3E family GTPase